MKIQSKRKIPSELEIRAACADDRRQWQLLWEKYWAFYEMTLAKEVDDAIWVRILDQKSATHCLVGELPDASLVGFVTYVTHNNTWFVETDCYLADLFVAENYRGRGLGRSLIEAVASEAKRHGWLRVYWQTKENNYRARTLFDQLAGPYDFIRYSMDL